MSMKERLPGRFQELLEPQDLLRPESLHQSTLNTLVMLDKDFGMKAPRLNTPLVLYRWMRDLALPLEVFAGSQRLALKLGIDFLFGVSARSRTSIVLRYPEAQLMAVVVVVTKLLWPFDDIERHPHSATDLSAMALDWEKWAKIHSEQDDAQDSHSRLPFEQAFEFSEADCLAATDAKLDAYLDWFGDNIASEEIREHGRAGRDAEFRKVLFDMFPVPREDSETITLPQSTAEHTMDDRVREVQRALAPNRVVEHSHAAGDVVRPGSFYRRFRTVEELSGPVMAFYSKAAALAGLSLESMVQVAFLVERKLQRHEENLRKSARER